MANPTEHRADPASHALLPGAAVICLAALALTVWASGGRESASELALESLHRCAAVAESAQRLACFDRLAEVDHPARGANAPLPSHQRP